MRRTSLKFQFSVTTAVVVLITVVLISVLSNIFINRRFRDYIMQQQELRTEEIVQNLSLQYGYEEAEWNTELIRLIGMYALYDGYIIKVYDTAGVSVWDAEHHDMSLCTTVMTEISERMQEKDPRINGEFTSRDYQLQQDGEKIGAVTISYYGPYFLNENEFQFLDALNAVLIGAGVFACICAVLLGWFIARKVSRPIEESVLLTKEIADGSYDRRIKEGSKTKEAADLITSVNNLADSLDKQETLRKQLTADVAHELRTPLTTVGTHLEAMAEGVWEPTGDRLESCMEEIRRITSLVKDLEHLADADSNNLSLNRQYLELNEIVSKVAGCYAAELYQKNQEITIEGTASNLYADSDRISQVLINLLSNAVKYTPANGHIAIRMRETEQNIIIEVEDDGEGIDAKDLPYIFERFYRADRSRNRKTGGAGIGLAIADGIVRAHRGSISVESKLGEGTLFIVSLPKPGCKKVLEPTGQHNLETGSLSRL